MKAITLGETLICCDVCRHEFPGEPPDWHNKPCPSCGAAGVISDHDLSAWRTLQNLVGVVNETVGEVPGCTLVELGEFRSGASPHRSGG